MFLEKWAEFLLPCQPHQSSRLWNINNKEHSTGINIPIDKWLRFVYPVRFVNSGLLAKWKSFLKNYLWYFISSICLKIHHCHHHPAPQRKTIFFRFVTSVSGVFTQRGQGRKECPLVEEEMQRANLWVELFNLELHSVHGRWSRAWIPGGISTLSSRYQSPPKWWDPVGLLVVWLGPQESVTKATRIRSFYSLQGLQKQISLAFWQHMEYLNMTIPVFLRVNGQPGICWEMCDPACSGSSGSRLVGSPQRGDSCTRNRVREPVGTQVRNLSTTHFYFPSLDLNSGWSRSARKKIVKQRQLRILERTCLYSWQNFCTLLTLVS